MSSNRESSDEKSSLGLQISARVLSVLLFAICVYFLVAGAQLAMLGGSWYYVFAGLSLAATALLLARLDVRAAHVYGVFFLVTVLWSIWEAGVHFWPLAARLGLFAVLGLLIALVVTRLPEIGQRVILRRGAYAFAGIMTVGLFGAVIGAFKPIWLVKSSKSLEPAADYQAAAEPKNWVGFGRTTSGEQFAPDAQITKDNINALEVAWTLRTGDITGAGRENQNTPLQIGNTLYPCTQTGQVLALRGDTGEVLWRFKAGVTAASTANWMRCRSLAYHEIADLPDNAEGKKRLYIATGDMRLMALDAVTGKFVSTFGEGGTVSLASGLGEVRPGFFNPTSGPLLAGENLIVGGWVMDNQSTDVPSGVVRAFNAVTGQLAWAWDVGRPGQTQAPADGESYTRGTPNMWATPSYDASLNMVYLPTGNGTPDLFGGQRSEATDRVSSAVVALDATTGEEKWVFQTVHHDVWDYDLPSKPVLYEMPDGKGGRIPALIQASKNGQIFVLDRRTGKPITRVEERPVPGNGVPGERLSPTQPYSVGMPSMRDDVLTEKTMWGITPIDQLYCRIQFASLHYEGDYTAPQLEWYLQSPSWYGTTNWGGQSIDKRHDVMILNDMRIMMKGRLLSREDTNKRLAATGKTSAHTGGVVPMDNTPYGAERAMVQSFLGVPCSNPPFGTMAAVDMKTQQVLWHRSLGTPEQFGPLGMKTHLPIELGMPTLGGAVSTGSGLIFYSATSDYYLRALDVATGEEVWKSPLPVGAGSTPLVFTSPEDGRQYVVVTASGSRAAPDFGDYIMAFALPKDVAAKQ